MMSVGQRKKTKFIGLISVIVCFSLLLSGCVSLKAIQNFAEKSMQTSAYEAFVDDYRDSLARTQQYERELKGTDAAKLEEWEQQNSEKLNMRENHKKGLKTIHITVVQYMACLATLASDNLFTYDTAMKGLAGELVANPAFSAQSKEVKAVGTISGILLQAFGETYRQDKLKTIIRDANAPFQDLIGSLKEFMGLYVTVLANEKNVLEADYGVLIKYRNEKEPTGVVLANSILIEKQAVLASRVKSANKYIELLNEIGKGHQYLYDHMDKLSDKEVLSAMLNYAQKITQIYSAIQALK